MISRNSLFSAYNNRPIQNIKLCPSAKYYSYVDLRESSYGVWVRELNNLQQGQCVSSGITGIVPFHSWVSDTAVQFPYDRFGDLSVSSIIYDVEEMENYSFHPENVKGQCLVQRMIENAEDTVLLGDNSRTSTMLDFYTGKFRSGVKELKYINNEFSQVICDSFGNAIVGLRRCGDGSLELVRFPIKDTDELNHGELVARISVENSKAFKYIGIDNNNSSIYVKCYEIETVSNGIIGNSFGTSTIVEINLDTLEASEVCGDGARVDVSQVILCPLTGKIQAIGRMDDYFKWEIMDKSIAADFEFLTQFAVENSDKHAFINIVDRSADDKTWLVELSSSSFSGAVYSYRRSEQKNASLTLLNEISMGSYHTVSSLGFSKVSVTVRARDGLPLKSYLTRPSCNLKSTSPGPTPGPMMLLVHGGPGGVRDTHLYDPWHQLFADRGCSVLSVNFRGSGGFGRDFEAAGHGEWGGKMMDDLYDAVEWAVKEKIADPDRVGIIGSSFGGYAAIAAIAKFPETFACSVAFAPLIDLHELATNFSSAYQPYEAYLWRQMGDPSSEEGVKLLKQYSPVNNIDKIKAPLLYAVGEFDEPSQAKLSDQFIQNLRANGNNVEYLKFPDEGHVINHPTNNLAYVYAVESFVSSYLNFKAESGHGELEKSSVIRTVS